MNEWETGHETGNGKKCVIVEVTDVFFEMKYPNGQNMEEIPDTTLIEDDKE